MAFKFNPNFINLGPLTATNFGIEPIDLSNLGSQSLPVNAPLSQTDLVASASRASSSPLLNIPAPVKTSPPVDYSLYGPPSPTTPATNVIGNTSGLSVLSSAASTATPRTGVETITINPRTQTPTTPSVDLSSLSPSISLDTSKTTGFPVVEDFVGPVSPGGAKPSPATVSDLALTPDFVKRTTAEDQVKSAFDKVLGRQPLPGPGQGLEYWTGELLSGRISPADLEGAIARGAQGGDRLAANQFLGTDFFKVADPTTVPYKSLLEATATVTNQPSVVQTYNQRAQERVEQEKAPAINTWEDIPNIDETEIQMARDAGYQSPLAYFLAKVESTDPELSSWRETTRDLIFTDRRLKDLRDEYRAPIDRDAEDNIYNELLQQYGIAKDELGYKYKHEGDIDEILRSQAAKLAAGGVKSIYEIGVRRDELPEMINGFYTYPELEELYPLTETLINKRTGDPIYDVSLSGSWRDDPLGYSFKGPEKVTIHHMGSDGYDRIGTNFSVRDQADLSFRMIQDAEGNEVPFILPIWKSTKDTSWMMPVTMLASAFLGPYAQTIGTALGATTTAGQLALGAGTISAGTQFIVNDGKIDPGSVLFAAGTAGLSASGNLTGADIADYSAQLAEQGLGSAQIAADLMEMGVNPVTANLAGNFASAGIPSDIAPMITSGTQNMGLVALATQSLDPDVLTNAFLRGAAGEASSLAVDKIIGDENLQVIADATGLTKDQAGSIATSAVMNGLNSEVAGTNNFVDAAIQTLVVSGVSTATANKVATTLDDMTSSKGRAAIVDATKNIMDVAGTAAWNDMDVGDALEFMAPTIIGSSISTYVRTPDIPKTDDSVKIAGPADREAIEATRNQPLIGEEATEPVTDAEGNTRRTVTGTDNDGNAYSYTISKDADGNVTYSYQTQDGSFVISPSRPNLKDTKEVSGAEVTAVKPPSEIGEKALEPAFDKDKALDEIGKEATFSGAFDKARDLLGPGETFDWKGKSYSTATAEERPDLVTKKPSDYTQTDTGAAFHMNVGRKYTDAEMNILNASLNDLVNNVNQVNAPTSEMDFVTAAATGQEVPVVGDKISADIARPFVAVLGAATRGGASFTEYSRGVLEGLEFIDRNSPLWNGMTDMADAMNKTADFQIGDYLKGKEENLIKTVSDADILDKPAALARAIYENPTALITMGISEFVEEAPSIAAMLVAAGPSAIYKVLSLGLGAATNFFEGFGQGYNETRDLGVKSGMTEEEAHAAGQKGGLASAALQAFLGTAGEAPLIRKAFGPGGVSTSIKREMATEPFEEGGQQAFIEYLATGKVDINNVATAATIAPAVAGTTTGMIGTTLSIDNTGEAANAVISANDPENSSAISQEVNNILGSSTNIQDATQSIASTLTDMGMDPTAAVAVGNTVAAEQVVNNINSQLPEDSKFSINNLNTLVGATDQGAPVTLGEYIGSSVSNVGPNIFVSPDIAIGTKNDGSILTVADISGSLDMTQTKGDTTTQTTTQTNPETNTTIKTETKTGPNTNITTTTKSNPDQNTETTTVVNNNVETNINVDNNTVTVTETNTDTNQTVTTNIDPLIEQFIESGMSPDDAVSAAVEETKEKAKTSRTGGGSATGAGMALPALGSLIQEDDTGLSPLRTTGKREFESPLAAFLRKVSGESEPELQPVEKKEPSMDYYSYGKPAEIDEVLGSVSPTGLPTFEFAELGEMGPSFQMRSGGLVPAFADGGPLTMAAGKLRRDYRQGDAVEGPGDGQSDDIPAMLADGEFVIPADVVAALGNGSNKAGADKLYEMMHNIRRQARKAKPEDLPKPAKSPLQYMTRR